MAWLLSVTTLPVGKTATSWCLVFLVLESISLLLDGFPLLSVLFFSFHLLWSGVTGKAGATSTQTPFCHLPSVQQTVCGMTKWRCLPPSRNGPPSFLKTHGNYEIWCCNIKVVEKAVFQWCYLSCSVLTPCNDDLSLFSVLCSIFIYDQASFSLYFFGFITHFLCHTCN